MIEDEEEEEEEEEPDGLKPELRTGRLAQGRRWEVA
jgi:hypothetical protein